MCNCTYDASVENNGIVTKRLGISRLYQKLSLLILGIAYPGSSIADGRNKADILSLAIFCAWVAEFHGVMAMGL